MGRVNGTVHVYGQRWALVHAFAGDPGSWLPLPAVRIDDTVWLSTVHGGPALQSVRIEVGDVRDLPDAFTRHIRWVPVARRGQSVSRALPVLEGQLRVEHRRPPGVEVVLAAHYRPPGGRVGNVLDAVAMHRVAERTVERSLEDIGERLRWAALTSATGQQQDQVLVDR